MSAFFDGPVKPGASDSYDIVTSLAATKSGFVKDALKPVVDRTTKSILKVLELGQKLTGTKDEAWVKIMMEQEKRFGSASPRGCYPVRTNLDLNHPHAVWKEPGDGKDTLYLVKNMLNRILDEGRQSEEWELRYPTIKERQWQENKEKRPPIVRLVIGSAPRLFFVDVPHTDQVQAELNKTSMLREICEGTVPDLFKSRAKPMSDWFTETPQLTPYMAIWLSDGDQSSLQLADPRMNVMMLRVHNSISDQQPMLPMQLSGIFAHALTDGEPAKQRLAAVWETVLSSDPKKGVRYQEQGRIATPQKDEVFLETVKPENPFREINFKYPGCEKFAKALGIDEVTEKMRLSDTELDALLQSAKKLGCKPNSLFMLGLLGISGAAPVTSVATREKSATDKLGKKRRKRIQMTTFGNKLAYDSAQFKELANWVKNPQKNVPLDELLKTAVFRDFPTQLSKDLFQHVGLYESLLNLAQQYDLGFLTHSAALADQRRATLEKLIGLFSPHMIALVRPQMQFSTLGAVPAIGSGALNWEFESACSETVVNTFGLIGNEFSFREFLDNPIGLFDVWQLYVQRNNFLPLELLNFTFSNGLLSERLIEWLRQLVLARTNKRRNTSMIASVPIEVGGIQFNSIHQALAEAGRNSAVMQDLFVFLNELLGFTADFMANSLNQAGHSQKFQTLIEVQAHLTMRQAMAMTEAVTYTLLQQNNFGDTQEADVMRKKSDFHKSECQLLFTELASSNRKTT